MPVVSSSLIGGASRPLLLEKRADLVVRQQEYLGRRYRVVKDPLALKYYRFEEEEYALLEMLDGRASLQEMQHRFEQRFAPQKISLQELHQFVGLLHRSCLVISHAAGQGRQLLERQRQKARSQRWATLSNVLCIRFHGVDPDRLLAWLDRRLGWFFSPACVLSCLAGILAALLLLLVQFDVLRGRLPAFHEFFSAQNWVALAATLAATKVLHEFGHGLACKRSGGECHEMGLMLLVLTPCLYCNVSDSWMLPSKWRRAAIGAAGMYVELVLAAAATFLWWFSQPGWLNYVCLNVMFVSSVSTIVFNANPLLRYDGYYILADLIEIPNLRQKSAAILRRKCAAWLLGMDEPHDPFLPARRQLFFALYSCAAACYRWLVVLGILWFLYRVFEPYGLKLLGQLLALLALYGLLVQPLWQVGQFLAVPGRWDRVKKARLAFSCAAAVAALAGLLWLPLPYYVRCSLFLEPREAASVYVESPGYLSGIGVQPGDWVRRGQPLVELENVDLLLTLARLRGQRQQFESKLQSLRQRAFEDGSALLQIPEVEQAITALDEQIAGRQQDCDGLQVTAPVSGIVLAPPSRPRPEQHDGRLAAWSGSPLESRNVQAHLDEGVAVCQIGDPHALNAVLAIDQADLESVHVGQPVEMVLEQLPGRRFRSRLEQLSQLDMKVSPASLSHKAGGPLQTRSDGQGAERPARTTYQASAPLEDKEGLLFLGATGTARIHAGRQTLAWRLWRYLCQTFKLEA